ncbi:unnamed protein product [Rotaria sp. Silwood1]|nr:unnamed protein product [Rotaria sp. Silwood1]CAF1210145.1 unnamed protein product [Rotaria sp. Silwood1]CAF3463855.1 unnamed protein product [Rotaria sp. Silwood1]CAF3506811.1 unnamed protein product [Rotaria sp. Silwood1]CAF4875390.1 unnamed protein product [Rotaria sp. Silwood1]
MHCTTYALLVFLTVTLINCVPFATDNENLDQQAMLHRGLPSCSVWYWSQPNPEILLAKTLKPPCNISPTFPSTLPGGWSVDPGCDASQQPNTCDLHKGAYGCYRSALSTTGPGAQACYDKNGQWISDPWKGAGTLDAETPLGDIIQEAKHVVADVLPYYSCCKTSIFFQTYNCNHYYEKRPPGQCQN